MTTLKTPLRLKAKARALPDELCDGKPHPGRRMTEEEFVAWCDDKTRAEWVDGEVIVMSPVNFEHASLHDWIAWLMTDFVAYHDLGTVIASDFQVRFARRRRRRVPDILFVNKQHGDRIKRTHLEGAPDLVVEVVSPDSESRDWRQKYLEYEAAGVPEYWIIDPLSQRVEAYHRIAGAYTLIPEKNGGIRSAILAGFFLRPEWLWQKPLPSLRAIAAKLGVK